MHMGLHMGLENVSHRKSFDPLHDLGAPLIHFNFSKIDHSRFPVKNLGVRINDAIASSGALADNRIRIRSGDFFSTTTFPDAGVVLINSEFFSYSGYIESSGEINILKNVVRNVAGTQSAHSADDTMVLIAGQYSVLDGPGTPGVGTGLRDFSDWSENELKVDNEGSAGGHLVIPTDPLNRPGGSALTSLGVTKQRRSISFDGDNDRLQFDNHVTTTDQNFTFVIIMRLTGTVSGDAAMAGVLGGVNQIKMNANTVLFRFNASGSANGFAQIRLNDTDTYTIGSRKNGIHGTVVDKGGAGNSLIPDANELIAVVSEVNSTDNKQKVYVYDAANLVGEEMLNSSGSIVQGYPNDGTVNAGAGFEMDNIGAFSSNAADFEGDIAVISLYDRSLSAKEIALLQEYYDNLYPDLRHD